MKTYTFQRRESRQKPAVFQSATKDKPGNSLPLFGDNRSQVVAQRKLQETMQNSPRVKQLMGIQRMAAEQTLQRLKLGKEKEAPVQGKSETIQEQPEKSAENKTGLPDTLKSGIENLSGYSMDDVKVHYNSSAPAQLQAHAYTQGTDIHVAPGQEQHLPHEAWHVVQQKQGRVQPTAQLKDTIPVNDDKNLEKEADVMGGKALGLGQQVVQQYTAVPKLNQVNTAVKQLIKASGNVMQLAEWKEGGDDMNATHYWDELMDGVQWYSNGKVLWYKIIKEGSEDYRALEREAKTWEQWHALRKIAHPEEYPQDERPDYSGPLMERYNARYVTDIKWADGSGVNEVLGKTIVIDTSVKKPDNGLQSVYQNSYNVLTDTFSADWNQRETDIKVGIKDPPALYNSDLLTCHREMARKFVLSEGVTPANDSDGFRVARHNINNSDWQNKIYPQLPIKVRGQLGQGLLVTRDSPCPFGKTVSFNSKDAVNMWDIFENMIPNTKAVFNMVAQRYKGYAIVAWRFESGTATAIIGKTG